MILYFSATGNNKYIAEQIAAAVGDRAMSILENDRIRLLQDEKLGFVFPTYFWKLPSIVDEYMKRVSIIVRDNEPYVYFIATYGTTCGGTGIYMRRHLRKHNLVLSAAYSIKTVDNWTVGFDVSNKAKVETTIEREKAQISEIVKHIKVQTKGNRMKNTLPMLAVCGSGYFYNKARKTKHLHVEDTCIGCGLCEKACPTNAIQIQDGRPIWIKKQCTMCLGCLHRCPEFAIQYDNKTQKHGQYTHP